MKSRGCKVYFSIAFICYLEVVLWTTLVLSGAGSISVGPEGSAYLHRETVNQGRAGYNFHPSLPESNVNSLVLKAFNLHQQLEHLSFQKLLTSEPSEKSSCCGPPAGQRFVKAQKGVPAPFSGILVIL
mmetsp:Transcript_760/g.2289  ORF Transcript_760/g.2289 Transcript_760/m.2289 type:complete len:128 (+) Transcript_760:612-995(+)